MRSSDLKTGSHLTLSQTSSLSPLLELFRRGNNSRSAVGAMRHRESAAGLHARDLTETTPKAKSRTPVPNKNSERGEKSRVLRFTAMMSPAWVVPQDRLASQTRGDYVDINSKR